MGLAAWPAVVDDDGTYTVGTVFNAAFFAAIKASIENAVFSSTNPAVTAADVIDEVVTARGSLATLDTRLDVSLNDDGTLKSLSGYPTTAEVQSGIKNLMHDDLCLLWPDGDAAAPYLWVLSGTGAVVGRCGVGLSDTQQVKYGDFCLKLTYGSAEAKLTKPIIAASPFARAGGLAGKKISFGCWCKSSISSHASILIDDGVTTTRGGTLGNGTYHSGSGNLEFIYCTHTMAAGSTKLDVICSVAQSGAAYFGNWVLMRSDLPPTDWFPARWGWMPMGTQQRGTLVAPTSYVSELRAPFPLAGGGILYDARCAVKTAPVGAAGRWDINKNNVSTGADTAEQAPALAAAGWTGGAGWDVSVAGVLNKNADGTGTCAPTSALTIAAGTVYKVVITVGAVSVGDGATYTIGGTAGTAALNAPGTYTHYVKATNTNNLIFTPTPTATRFTITAVSVKAMAGWLVIADGSTSSGALRPDGTYATRCFKENDLLSIDCDRCGVATAGEDASLIVRFWVPIPAWGEFKV